MDDLFAEEQKILDDALLYASELRDGATFEPERFYELAVEYRRVLKLLRRKTKMSDRSAMALYESNLDLNDKVHYDALTGIYNRRYMEENLGRAIHTISRAGNGQLSVMMVDIDYFKAFNDTYGHSLGDFCLQEVAAILATIVTRADDFISRYGGEEFAVILPNTDKNGATYLAASMLEAVRMRNIPHEQSDVASHVTISIGVTTGEVRSRQCKLDYIKRADEALYLSKKNGRNRFTFFQFEEGS